MPVHWTSTIFVPTFELGFQLIYLREMLIHFTGIYLIFLSSTWAQVRCRYYPNIHELGIWTLGSISATHVLQLQLYSNTYQTLKKRTINSPRSAVNYYCKERDFGYENVTGRLYLDMVRWLAQHRNSTKCGGWLTSNWTQSCFRSQWVETWWISLLVFQVGGWFKQKNK